jgi:hypothetical protein
MLPDTWSVQKEEAAVRDIPWRDLIIFFFWKEYMAT